VRKLGVRKSLDFFVEIYHHVYEYSRKVKGKNNKMMKEIDAFVALEEKIAQLVEDYSSLKNGKIALAEKLGQKEMELKDLKEKVDFLSEEREMAKKKVENLLSRIDRILSQGKEG
jgi:chromosome segregation ATPase